MGIEKFLPEIKRNVLLKNYTTFKIGGPAKYFFEAKNKKDLIKAIKLAKKLNLPFFILGGGSNILVSDRGYDGLVIKFQIPNSKFQIPKFYVEAGTPLALLVRKTMEKNLTGLEWAIGIPGTVGGAIYGNAGAFGKSMKDLVKEVEVFDLKNEKIKILKNKDCQFDYRDSIFKKRNDLIILSAKIELKKGAKKEIEKKMKDCLRKRKESQPLNFPSAGCIFKNPEGFSAGFLIEKSGLKGKKIGGAQISKKHSNFIINLGGAKADDVLKLISLAKEKVREKFKIELEEEIQYLPPQQKLIGFGGVDIILKIANN